MTNEILSEYGNDPFALFEQWFEQAKTQEPNDPDAFCLATCDGHGKPSARMVLMKEISDRGIKFHTNEKSQKGGDIVANPYGALCMYWKSTRKQIRAEGRIEPVSEQESDEYFSGRSRERQIGAWASQQSKPYDKKEDLENAVQEYQIKFGQNDISRPPHWKGFRLVPERIEFWIGNKDRLHTRFEYVLNNGVWTARWLYP